MLHYDTHRARHADLLRRAAEQRRIREAERATRTVRGRRRFPALRRTGSRRARLSPC